MSYSIDNTTITLTRGDTLLLNVSILNEEDEEEYIPEEDDQIFFAVKEKYTSDEYVIFKEIPIETMRLQLDPEDTKDLNFKTYVYDMQLNKANGEVYTFITKSEFIIAEEVC